jgi:DNA polymerase III sliding clamp (beta) subunit (PCNA family)
MGMRVSCLQDNLARGLGIVSRAVSTRTTLPVLANVLLATDNGRLRLSATNLELSITAWIGASVEEDGAITVPARTLNDLVNTLSPERVDMRSPSATRRWAWPVGRRQRILRASIHTSFRPSQSRAMKTTCWVFQRT